MTTSPPQQQKQTIRAWREDERVGTNLRRPTCGRSHWCGGTWGERELGRSPPSPAHLRPQITPLATEPTSEFHASCKTRGLKPWYSLVGAAGASYEPALQKMRQSRARPRPLRLGCRRDPFHGPRTRRGGRARSARGRGAARRRVNNGAASPVTTRPFSTIHRHTQTSYQVCTISVKRTR
jgi:hypothetical protein